MSAWFLDSELSTCFYINCLPALTFSQHTNNTATIWFMRVFEWLPVFILRNHNCFTFILVVVFVFTQTSLR